MVIKFKNNKQTSDIWCGVEIQPSDYYEISSIELLKWQTDSKVLSDIGSGDGIINNGTSDIEDVNSAIDYLKNLQPRPVITQFERTDIVLKICCNNSTFDVNGEATLNFQVPGTPGTADGRYVAGGYAFTDVMGFGDKVEEINVIDIDDILGYGANAVLQTYHETDLSDSYKGWYFWPSPQAGGEIEIDPMGYYGFLPSGLYLQIKFKKTEASGATKVFCNTWWGTQIS
jgi:hypothetical protein